MPPKTKIKQLVKILKCSMHDLHRPYLMPKIGFTETNEIIEKKEEPIMSDEDMVKAASEVFMNSYNSNNSDKESDIDVVKPISNVVKNNVGHPVVNRVNKYLADNNMSQNELSRRTSISNGSINRICRGVLLSDNPHYTKIENYLNSVENNVEVNASNGTKNLHTTEVKDVEFVKEQVVEEPKTEEKATITDRMKHIYDTLFNALDELDKLKADIDKIEKISSMIKEIQGL